MAALPHDREPVRVEADGAEIEAPRDQAVTAVLEEGERVEHTWTASDFADKDWEHPDTRPRMRGWLHLFAFFGSIAAAAVLIPLASVLGAARRLLRGALLPDDPRAVRRQRPLPPAPVVTARLEDHEAARPLDDLPVHRRHLHAVRPAGRRPADRFLGPRRRVGRGSRRRHPEALLAHRPPLGGRAALHRPGLGRRLRAHRHPAHRRRRLDGAARRRRAALHRRRHRLRHQEAQPLARAPSATTRSSTR